jgi:hypothetical protein
LRGELTLGRIGGLQLRLLRLQRLQRSTLLLHDRVQDDVEIYGVETAEGDGGSHDVCNSELGIQNQDACRIENHSEF